jgi:adenylate cyclase
VLPFSNMSSDIEQEYFSDGLTEDIITQLSRIKSFRVISRTSVMQYKKNPKSIKEIGKELGVAHILEGSVQRAGDHVRITSQLINARTDEHVWADTYDRPLKDIFTIQREVAMSIASVLNTTLTRTETQILAQTPTANLHSYDLCLRAKFLLEKRNKTDLLVARDLFQQAVKKDKAFALAYTGLADTYLLSSFRGYEEPEIMLPQAKKYIDLAMEINPNCGETHATLGYWYHQKFQWKEAEASYEKSIELNPSQSNPYLWLGLLLEAIGEREEALHIYNDGCEINPSWEYLIQNKIRMLAAHNEQEEAIRLQMDLISKATNDALLQKQRYSELARMYWHFDRPKEAIMMAAKAGNLALIQYYRESKNQLLLKAVEDKYARMNATGEYFSPLWMGIDYAQAGAKEKAVDCFTKAIADKDPALTLLLIGHYEFLNLKFLKLAHIARKVREIVFAND